MPPISHVILEKVFIFPEFGLLTHQMRVLPVPTCGVAVSLNEATPWKRSVYCT